MTNEMMNVQPAGTQAAVVQGNNQVMNYVDPAAVAAAESAKARIQAAYTMAAYRPRNEDQARVKILNACRRPAFAERVEYAKPVGKDRSGQQTYINGPSIRFAELCIREWGNIDCQNQVVYEDDDVRRVRITVTDLETNSSLSKEVQLSKNVERKSDKGREVVRERINSWGDKIFVVRATDDEMQIKTDAAISKALRNEGLRLIPQDIVDEAIDTARATMRNRDAEDPEAAKKKLIDAFYSVGVEPAQLMEYLGHEIKMCTPAELADLRRVYSAIRSGDAKWADFMEPAEEEANEGASKAKAKLEDLKTRKAAEKAAAESQPPKSYRKEMSKTDEKAAEAEKPAAEKTMMERIADLKAQVAAEHPGATL